MKLVRHFRHLTYTDRLKIEALHSAGVSKTAIAEQIGCSLATIYNELKRGHYIKLGHLWEDVSAYSADIGQAKIDFSRRDGGPSEKIGNRLDICELLSLWLRSGLSPAVCSARLSQNNYGISLSTNTIYSYIKKGYIPGFTFDNLPEAPRRKHFHKGFVKPRRAPAGRSIEKRPPVIFERSEPGHWEMDCIIGKSAGRRQALLTLTERAFRFEIVIRLDRKDAASVVRAVDKIEKYLGPDDFKRIFRSITVDNGCEFSDVYGLEHSRNGSKRTDVYYCHPYCSSERGTNERHNRLLRRFFPKGTSLWWVTQSDCNKAADWLNNYPRLILGWSTPAQLFYSYFFGENFSKQNGNFLICS